MDCKDCVHYAVCWRVKEVETGNPMFTNHYICRKFEASTINNIPAEGVQPVKHGKWFLDEDSSSEEEKCYRCSNCNAALEEDYKWHNHNYCYHCGAKMDRSEENDD